MEQHEPLKYIISDQQVISPKEARKLLGKKSKNLTNEELLALITDTETVVRIAVRDFVGSKNSKNNANINEDKVVTL